MRLLVLPLLVLGCQTPRAPSADEARAAYLAREKEIDEIHLAVLDEIVRAGLGTPRIVCSPPDDSACLTAQRDRDRAVAAGRVRLQKHLATKPLLCAEISVTSGTLEELAVSVATCPPGRRGDSIDPEKGEALEAKTLLGRGVYFGKDGVHRRGIAVRRTLIIETARVSSVLYYPIDS